MDVNDLIEQVNSKITFFHQMKHGENTVLPGTVVWLAVSEDSISLLELRSMQLIETYMFGQVLTFGGCQDDFMLVIASDSAIIESHKLLFSLSKPKVKKLKIILNVKLGSPITFFSFYYLTDP